MRILRVVQAGRLSVYNIAMKQKYYSIYKFFLRGGEQFAIVQTTKDGLFRNLVKESKPYGSFCEAAMNANILGFDLVDFKGFFKKGGR